MSDFIETREIADTELDNVAGGILGVDPLALLAPVVAAAPAPVGTVVTTVVSAVPAPVAGLL